MINNSSKLINFSLVTVIILITIVKLNLAGTGFLCFPDEQRYFHTVKMLNALSNFNFREAVDNIFSAQGRPGDVIVKIIPTTLQYATARLFNLYLFESNNSYMMFLYNYMVHCLIIFFFYKLSRVALQEQKIALCSVLIYCSLTNSYLYIKHALPYDASLLFFLYISYKTFMYIEGYVKDNHKYFLVGFISFAGYLIYPGYFVLYIHIFFMLVLYKKENFSLREKISIIKFHSLGSITLLALAEALSLVGGKSYITSALSLSTTITQGSFEESFSFIIKYLLEVERLAGLTVICLTILTFIFSLKQKRQQYNLLNNYPVLVGLISIALYLFYASAGFFMHKFVFYGRLLHQFFPFLCIFSLSFICKMQTITKNTLIVLLSVISTQSFSANFLDILEIEYPRDVVWRLINKYGTDSINNICEHTDSWSIIPSKKELEKTGIFARERKHISNKDIILVNGCFFYPFSDISKYNSVKLPTGFKLRELNSYFLNFKAYQFEGYSITERENIDFLNLNIKTFVKDTRLSN